MRERIAIIEGVRTPFCKAGGALRDLAAEDLGAFAVRELLARAELSPNVVDELIFGNVLQPPHATNIARVLSVKGGLPDKCPAMTVNRNCASGMEAVACAMQRIREGDSQVVVAGGTESMSHFPILFSDEMRTFLTRLSKAKSLPQKLSALLAFRPRFLAPVIPQIADPICGLTMGQTAEVLVREFRITREEQDLFALMSQQRAVAAKELLSDEIVPIPIAPKYSTMQCNDEGPRLDQTLEALQKLPPVFDRYLGTVTAGSSSQVTDGAAAILLTSESKAKELGIKPLGYLVDYAYAALEPSRMGLGPVFATAKLLEQSGKALSDFDLIEINEAFAAQVIACERAFASDEFAQRELGLESAIGILTREKLNVNGGAIALGHPVGASGTRLIVTLLKELKRRNGRLGLATLCVGGGQGEAVIVEVPTA